MMRVRLLIIFLTFNVIAYAQTIPNYKKPLFVSHLSGTQKTMLFKPGAPQHNAISRTICFKFKCRSVIGWKRTQQRNKFKGYKKPGIPRLKYLKNDSLREERNQRAPVINDTITAMAAEPVRRDSVISF